MHEEVRPARVEIASFFLPTRNALALRVGMEPIYTDYYLHLMQHELRLDPAYDNLLKDALATMALHSASRPRDEVSAWTVHYPHRSLNLFVTANPQIGNVTGRVFTDHIREGSDNLFYSQVARGGKSPRQSVVQVQDGDFLAAAELFYRQSQQLPARFFRLPEHETFGLLAAMPECDLPWFESLGTGGFESLAGSDESKLLETRTLYFGCECTLPRIVTAIAALRGADTDELFGESERLEISCPRCGARYQATREDIERARH